MAAHSVETQLTSESQREIHVQKRPAEPSKQQNEKHNLTYERFEELCELSVSLRARQDKHAVADDSQKFDIYYLSMLDFVVGAQKSLQRRPLSLPRMTRILDL